MKVTLQFCEEIIVSSINGAVSVGLPYWEKCKPGPYLGINVRCIIKLKVKGKTIKPLDKKSIEGHFNDLGVSKDF